MRRGGNLGGTEKTDSAFYIVPRRRGASRGASSTQVFVKRSKEKIDLLGLTIYLPIL